jgi:hypothetical protein
MLVPTGDKLVWASPSDGIDRGLIDFRSAEQTVGLPVIKGKRVVFVETNGEQEGAIWAKLHLRNSSKMEVLDETKQLLGLNFPNHNFD